MKYEIYLDDENYITGFCHFANERDVVEIPKEVTTSDHLNCWKYENNTFTFDEDKKEKEDAEAEAEAERQSAKSEQTDAIAERFVDDGESANDFFDRLDAQTLYTALCTGTIIEGE